MKHPLVLLLAIGMLLSTSQARLPLQKRHCQDPVLAGTIAGKKLAITTAHFVASTHGDFKSGITSMHKWINGVQGSSIDKDAAIRSFNFNYRVYYKTFSHTFHDHSEKRKACILSQCGQDLKAKKAHLHKLHLKARRINKSLHQLKIKLRTPGINKAIFNQIKEQQQTLLLKRNLVRQQIADAASKISKCASHLEQGSAKTREIKEKEVMTMNDNLHRLRAKHAHYNEKVTNLKFKLRGTKDKFKRDALLKKVQRLEAVVRSTHIQINKLTKCLAGNQKAANFARDTAEAAAAAQEQSKEDLAWQKLLQKEVRRKSSVFEWKRKIKVMNHQLTNTLKRIRDLRGQLTCIKNKADVEKDALKKKRLIRRMEVVQARIGTSIHHSMTLKKEVVKSNSELKISGIKLRKVTEEQVFKAKLLLEKKEKSYSSAKAKLYRTQKDLMNLRQKLIRTTKLSKRRHIHEKIHKEELKVSKQKQRFSNCKKQIHIAEKRYVHAKRLNHVDTRDFKRVVRDVTRPTMKGLKNDLKRCAKRSRALRHKSANARGDIQRLTVKIDKLKDKISQTKDLLVKKRHRHAIERYRKEIKSKITIINRVNRHVKYERHLMKEDRRKIDQLKKKRNYVISCQRAKIAELKKRGALLCHCGVSSIVLKRIKRDITLFKKRKHELKKKKKAMRKDIRKVEKLRRKLRRTTDPVQVKDLKRKLKIQKRLVSKEKRIVKTENHYLIKVAKTTQKERAQIKKAKIQRKQTLKLLKEQKALLRKMMKKTKSFKFGHKSPKDAKKDVAKDLKKVKRAQAKAKKDEAKIQGLAKKVKALKAQLKTEKDFVKKEILLKKIKHVLKKENKKKKQLKRENLKVKEKKKELKKAKKEVKKAIRRQAIKKERKYQAHENKKIQKIQRKVTLKKEKLLRIERKTEKTRIQLKFARKKEDKAKLRRHIRHYERKVERLNKKIKKVETVLVKRQTKLDKHIKGLVKKNTEKIKKNKTALKKEKVALKAEKKVHYDLKQKYVQMKDQMKVMKFKDEKAKNAYEKKMKDLKKKVHVSHKKVKKIQKKMRHVRRHISNERKFIYQQRVLKKKSFGKKVQNCKKEITFREIRIKKDVKDLEHVQFHLKSATGNKKKELIFRQKQLKKAITIEKKSVEVAKKDLKVYSSKYIKEESIIRKACAKSFHKSQVKVAAAKAAVHKLKVERKALKLKLKTITDAKIRKDLKSKLKAITRKVNSSSSHYRKIQSRLITKKSQYKASNESRQNEYKSSLVKYKLLVGKCQKISWHLRENKKMIKFWQTKIAEFKKKLACLGGEDKTIQVYIKTHMDEANKKLEKLNGKRKLWKGHLSVKKQKLEMERTVIKSYHSHYIKHFKTEMTQVGKSIASEKKNIANEYKQISAMKKSLEKVVNPEERKRIHREVESVQIHIEKEKKHLEHQEAKISKDKTLEKTHESELKVVESKEESKIMEAQFIHEHKHEEFEENLAHIKIAPAAPAKKKLLLI